MPRRFDAYATLQRRIKFLEDRIDRDRAELELHREAVRVYEENQAKAAARAHDRRPGDQRRRR